MIRKEYVMRKIIILPLLSILSLMLTCCGEDKGVQNKPSDTPANTGVQTTDGADNIPTEDPEAISGQDWRTQRSYTESYRINDTLSVCLSLLDDKSGYAVYDDSNGERIGLILLPEYADDLPECEITCEDYNSDGNNDISLLIRNSFSQCYLYNPERQWSADDTEGCFSKTVYPDSGQAEAIETPELE